MKNKNNAMQNQIAKESIFTALMILMEQKDFHKITVSEITKIAGVSRMAFYRNYNQAEDIITVHLAEYLQEHLKQLLDYSNFYDRARLLFSCFRKQEKLISNLLRSNMTNLILECSMEFYRTFSKFVNFENTCSVVDMRYHTEFITGGFYQVLIGWAKNDMEESDETMALFITNSFAKLA